MRGYLQRQTTVFRVSVAAMVLLCFVIGKSSLSAQAGDPVTGLIYYAVEDLDNDLVSLRGVAGSQGVAFDNLILPSNTNLRIWLLEAATFRTAHVVVRTPNPGLTIRIPRFVFSSSSSHDSDLDGLHDLGEFIVGTLGMDPDTDDDGIKDGPEVAQGLNPLGSLIARTGIVGSADTPGEAKDVDAFNDIVVVADSNAGVLVFNVFNGMDPLIIAQVNTNGSADAVSLAGDLLAVVDGEQGVAIINVSDPPAAAVIHQIPLGSPTIGVATDGQFAFVGLQDGNVVAIEMGSGLEVDRIDISNTSQIDDLRVYGGKVYAVSQNTLHILDFEFGELSQINTIGFEGFRNTNAPQRIRLFVGGEQAYVTHSRGYVTIDVSDPENPSVLGNAIAPEFGWKQLVGNGNGFGFVAFSPNSTFDGPHNVALYDISDPAVSDNLISSFETPGVARAVTIYNGIGYVADNLSGLHVVNFLAFDGLGEPPSVSISQPQSGSEIEEGSSFLVRANVQDDVQVRNVEYYVNDVLQKTDGNFPFEVTLRAASLTAANTMEVVARASDTGGNASFSEPILLTLTPDSTPPRVTAVLPVDNGFVGEASGFSVFFSEGIDPDTINELSIFLTGEGEDGLLGTADDVILTGGSFTQSEDGSIVSYSLNEVIDSGYFQITVETSITDNTGNMLMEHFSSVFLALGDTDTDRDGLPDVIELNIGLDPNDPDSDVDGIFDGREDNDQDGVSNEVEAFLGFDLAAVDSDQDGINDNLEDQDMDSLPDFEEVLAGSNINEIDSDMDGFSDDAESISGSSPINPMDIPTLFVAGIPPASVLLLNSESGSVAAGVTMADPPVAVTLLSSNLGSLEPSVTVARPPANVMILASQDDTLPPSVTLANPPVQVTDPVEP